MSRLPHRTLMVEAAALAVAAIPGLRDGLLLSRDGVVNGRLHLLLTGHLVHAGAYHLAVDVIPLVLLGLLFERALGRRYWPVMLASALVVGLGILALQPQMAFYCGLSGVLNGLWVAGALVAARDEERQGRPGLARLYRLCVLADLGKIGIEGLTGAALFTDVARLGVPPVPLAHALGALGGVLALAGPVRRDRLEGVVRPRGFEPRTF